MPAVISDGGNQAQRVYIHDIDMFVNHLYNQGIRFDVAGCSGVIENIRVSNAELLSGGEIMLLDSGGAEPGWTVRNNIVRTSRDGIVIEAGDVYIHDNEFINCATAIKLDTAGAGNVIGHNTYRDVTTPFVDAGIAATDTQFEDVQEWVWYLPGTITTGTGVEGREFRRRGFIVSVSVICDTAGVGTGSNTFDVHLNGTTIFTTQGNRPAMAAASVSSGDTGPDVRPFAIGDVLTVDVDAITATTACVDAVITVRYVELPAA